MDGQEVVMGTVFMLKGENSREVAQRVSDVCKKLPPLCQKALGLLASTTDPG